MKNLKLVLIGLMIAGLGLAAFGQSITVTSPAGGERWALGSAVTITWTASDPRGDVLINLVAPDGSVAGTICATARARAGSQPWTVGTLVDGSAPAGENYRIRVRSVGTRILGDSLPFAIIASGPVPEPEPEPEPAASELTLTAPNGGQVWYLGETQNITWRSRNLAGVEWVKLSLYKDGRDEAHFVGVISPSCAIGSGGVGSMPWNPGAFYTGGTAPVGNNCYYVKVSTLDNALSDFSNAPFSVNLRAQFQELPQMERFTPPAADGPGIEVPTPLAPLTISHRFTINWAARGVTSDLVINLLKESGGTFTIATGVDPGRATGHFTWKVGKLATSGSYLHMVEGERFRFQIAGRGAVGLSRWFEIRRPVLAVTEPHSGQRLQRGDRTTIRWSAPDLRDNVKIEAKFMRTDGVTMHTYQCLAASARNTGHFEWTIWPPPRAGEADLDPPPSGEGVRWYIIITAVDNHPLMIASSPAFIIE